MAAANDAPFIISRREAVSIGQPWYFLKPCLHGHHAKRLTSNKLCLECHRITRAALRASDPGRIKTQKAASYLRNREKVIAKVKAYTKENTEKVRLRRRKHREANKPLLAEINAEWRAANRHISRQHERNRRARERGAEGTHTAADIEAIRQMQRNRCAAPNCRAPLTEGFHVDHIKPLALGGSNWPRNLQLLCAPCNQAKHARDPIEWAQTAGLLL